MALEEASGPKIAVNGEELPKCTLKFQCGLLRETETFLGDDVRYLCTEAVLEYVSDMLYFKYPDHPYGDLYTKLHLFKHDERNDSLSPLLEDDEILDGMIIEIVLAANVTQDHSTEICSHLLRVHTYKGPTFCDHCGVLMIGILKQGLKCEGCDKNFHKKCAYKVPNDCTRYWTERGSAPPTPGGGATWSGRPLWIDKAIHSRPQVPHTFFMHSFKKPTACQKCKKLIKGMYKNGMKCKDCGYNCHKKCAKDVGKNCPGEVPSLSKVDTGEYINTRVVINNEQVKGVEVSPESKEVPVGNGVEDGISVGSAQEDEQLEENMLELPQSMDTIAEEPSGDDNTSNEGSEHNLAESTPSGNITLQRVTGVSMRHTKQPPATVLMEGWMIHYTNKSNIRKKHYWRLDTKCLTLYKSNDSDHYYKEVQLADILAVDPMINASLYPLSPPHVFEIVTTNCTYYVGIDMTGIAPEDLPPPSTNIEIAGSNILGDISSFSIAELEEIGVGLNMALVWEESLHNALMPITPQASMGSLAEIGGRPHSFRSKRGSFQGSFRGSFRTSHRAGSFRSGSIRARKGSTKAGSFRGSFKAMKQNNPPVVPMRPAIPKQSHIKPKIETKLDITLFYQLFPEDILGSGQFGTVYAGQNRTSSKHVAVKVIDKLRFPHKQDAALRQEVTILQTLSHPGIITLEQMFETPEKIHIVMEKMNGDMLEMILSSPSSRLTERVTKFLTHQILTALQYLHKKDIVHCDLKPENVLLTSESGMPQAKLCDFGFARIIGEKSFRKSIVGTPAYLAPEVLKNEGYNRSLDLWSVGVIIYVSLSGTFPFNEDEEVSDQIHNAAFMYPPDPWAMISREGVDMVSHLLQLSRRTRYKTNQALHHVWLNDLQLWEDLCVLEGRLGVRYLTHYNEDEWWMKQGAKPHPLTIAKPPKFQHHTYNNITILEDPRHGAPTIATTAMIANVQEKLPTIQTTGQSSNKESSSIPNGKGSPTPSNTSRKSAVELENEEVERSEQHARRVGYTVSSV